MGLVGCAYAYMCVYTSVTIIIIEGEIRNLIGRGETQKELEGETRVEIV